MRMESLNTATHDGSIPAYDGHLICPVVSCACDNVHLGALRSFPHMRGTRIEVDCWCECNHKWTMALWFHKGTTYSEIVGAASITPFDPDVPEMWRD